MHPGFFITNEQVDFRQQISNRRATVNQLQKWIGIPMRNVLVTGGAGFIGSHFIRYLLNHEPDCSVINVDSLTYAGQWQPLHPEDAKNRQIFIKADVTNKIAINKIFIDYSISDVVHFAAETHVDNSIDNPELFFRTNVIGTQVMLEAARQCWTALSNETQPRFIYISTDEVYGSLESEGLFDEMSPMQPNNPYSASKASADLMVRSYFRTFGLPVITTRSCNNYGPGQLPEKLIPMTINRARRGDAVPIYGSGNQQRDWLHVTDHCHAIHLVLRHGSPGDVYNIGGDNEQRNRVVVQMILDYMGQSRELMTMVNDRPGHDKRYALDSTKIKRELGWQPEIPFKKGLEDTIDWYLRHGEWLDQISQ
jgi:dTDP-glucose 4,6-dehydratase